VSLHIIELKASPPDKCELCGVVAELRPYGPNRERICYECGMKDRATTERQMNASPHFQTLKAAIQGADVVIDARTKEEKP
jgi:hypothetical protein